MTLIFTDNQTIMHADNGRTAIERIPLQRGYAAVLVYAANLRSGFCVPTANVYQTLKAKQQTLKAVNVHR